MQFDLIGYNGALFSLMNNNYVDLVNIDGQTSANSNLTSQTIGGIDGDEITNVQAQPRPLILDLRIKTGVDVEAAKRAVLSVVKLKRNCSIVWQQNNRKTTITGIVESVDMPRWTNETIIQITLHCSQPFWEDIAAVIQDINEALPLHYFTDARNDMLFFPASGIPFGEYDKSRTRNIQNAGDVSVGMEIEILAYNTVTNPIIYGENGAFFGVGYGTGNKKVVMQTGDIIKINTVKCQKNVTMNGQTLFDKIKPRSTWLQLPAGNSLFSIDSDDDDHENMTFTLSYKRRYI